MEVTPAKFLALFLFLSGIGWLLFMFTARLLSWMLSQVIKAKVGFRFGGLLFFKDFSVVFKQGPLESLMISEMRLRISRPFADSLNGAPSSRARLQILLCDTEVVLRRQEERKRRSRHKKQISGRGKWMLFRNIAKYVTISLVELTVQVPDWMIEVKELDLALDRKDSNFSLFGVRLTLGACTVCERECFDNFCTSNMREKLLPVGGPGNIADGVSALIFFEYFSMNAVLGHVRDHGVNINQLNANCGEVHLTVSDVFIQRRLDAVKNGKTDEVTEANSEPVTAAYNGQEKSQYLLIDSIPEKASVSFPKLLMRCNHREKEFILENEVIGIQLSCNRIRNEEDSGSLSRLDVHIEADGIQLLREGDQSLLQVMKLATSLSLEIHKHQDLSIQVEVDVKLGGVHFNLLIHRFEKWINLVYLVKPQSRKSVLSSKRKLQKPRSTWTLTISAPDMTASIYDLNGIVLFHICLQTSHILFDSISEGQDRVCTELAEFQIYLVEEEHAQFKGLFGMDTNSGCLLQISRVTFDWGTMETPVARNDLDWKNASLAIDVIGTSVNLTMERLQMLLSFSMRFASHFKSLVAARNSFISKKRESTIKQVKSGIQIKEKKLCFDGILVQFCEHLKITSMDVPDPKKVNFGSQGGMVVVERNEDGRPRVATIKVATFGGFRDPKLICKGSLEITHLMLKFDGDKGAQMDVQKLNTIYQELGPQMKPIIGITIAALQSANIVYQPTISGNGVPDCLIRAAALSGRWEPDVQMFFLDAFLQLKCFFHDQRQLKSVKNNYLNEQLEHTSKMQKHSTKGHSLVVAVDIEHVEFSAALADGVEGLLSIAYVFSEDLKVGVLLEKMKVVLNGAAILRTERLQAARLPTSLEAKTEKVPTGKCSKCGAETKGDFWDYLVQGSGVQIIMPYRLELRAIDDAVEDTWRGLKLAMAAQKVLLGGTTNTSDYKSKKKPSMSHSHVGVVKLIFESITAEIEEEPIQGWLDEHHQMMSQQHLELQVRECLLDEFFLEGSKLSWSELSGSDLKYLKSLKLDQILEGREMCISDLKGILQQQAFQAYYRACQDLKLYESSGSYRSALQSGFKPSKNRGSLLLGRATELEAVLLDIEGGVPGMIKQIQKLDCIDSDIEIPYSRVLGKQVKISTATLAVHLRNYTLPILYAKQGRCDGKIIFARQATRFPRQVHQEIYIGRWRKITMLRSESGRTPPFKMFSELPIEFEKAEFAYGVGFEPSFTDLSYAFTVALRKADLSVHDLVENAWAMVTTDLYGIRESVRALNNVSPPVKKERSLPWWDDMRYYLHGNNSIASPNFKLVFLATTDPNENRDMMKIEAGFMNIQQQEGKISFFAKDFVLSISSLEGAMVYQNPLPKSGQSCIQSPFFQLDISMIWDCETGKPLFHYLHVLPNDLAPQEKLYDPFRSTSLILRFNFCLGDPMLASRTSDEVMEFFNWFQSCHRRVSTEIESCLKLESSFDIPVMNLGGHDLLWIFKWWSTIYSPPLKLRTFSKWPRFGLPRVVRSGNLSFDKVLTDFMLRLDSSPAQIRHVSLGRDDPAEGLTFDMRRLKYELWYSRGKQRYTFDSKRDILELVYQGLDLHALKANLKEEGVEAKGKCKPTEGTIHVVEVSRTADSSSSKSSETGFFFTTDYFSLRKQAPKADLSRLYLWQQESRTISQASSTPNAAGSGSDPGRSDPSDDDGFNIVLPDNCLRVSLYSLKLLWTIANRDAVWAWVEDLHKAFESPRPSPSRQYAHRKILEEQDSMSGADAVTGLASSSPSSSPSLSYHVKPVLDSSSSRKAIDSAPLNQASSHSDQDEEGTMHFMVNVVQPQFNLHSEDARGRFLLAAASGRVIARSFHSILQVRPEMIAQALRQGGNHMPGNIPELTWNRRELSVILEHVQAHVAPTDVDPGAGLQWLPEIPRGSPKVKRTGALLERVFMPCAMYFQYTRCKSDTADLKVKPLKELSFNSSNIIALMTSRQFQVIVDVISNLLLARLPKPRRNSPFFSMGEDDDIEEETDEVVPDGLPEVELARIELEKRERELRLLINDIRRMKQGSLSIEEFKEVDNEKQELWMMSCGIQTLRVKLKDNLKRQLNVRKTAAVSLRNALRCAAQQRFKEKESTVSAMRISWTIDKIAWSMIADGHAFAEAEISNMILNVDRDFHEVGIAQFTVKYFVVKNCLPNAKSNTVLSAWNPPHDWARNVMLRVDARQGAPKDGHSPMELLEVEIYPLKIHLTEIMYRMMWDYFFPEENQDSQRQQVWKESTTARVKRGRKVATSSNQVPGTAVSRQNQISVKSHSSTVGFLPGGQPEACQGIDFRLTADVLGKDLMAASARSAGISSNQRTPSFGRNSDAHFPGCVTVDATPKLEPKLSVSSSKSSHYIRRDEGDSTLHVANLANENTGVRQRDNSHASKLNKSSAQEDKKIVKSSSLEEKKSSKIQHRNLEFHSIKISQVELSVTYEGSRLSINDLRLLMDTFTRVEFTGTWRRLFSRVKKHIIWGVLKSVAGMQGKKFKDKLPPGQGEGGGYPGDDSSSSDSDASNTGMYEQFYPRHSDRAGEGFVSSIRGLFNSQRKKAKAVVLRGIPGDVEEATGAWMESGADAAPIARQLSISKARRLLRRHTKKFLSSTRHRGSMLLKDQAQESPSFQSELSSDASSCYEDFND